MLIEIESAYGDRLIHGKYLDRNELKTAMQALLQTAGEENFVTAFCARYAYEAIPYSDGVRPDYRMDLDTHLLLKLKYD